MAKSEKHTALTAKNGEKKAKHNPLWSNNSILKKHLQFLLSTTKLPKMMHSLSDFLACQTSKNLQGAFYQCYNLAKNKFLVLLNRQIRDYKYERQERESCILACTFSSILLLWYILFGLVGFEFFFLTFLSFFFFLKPLTSFKNKNYSNK